MTQVPDSASELTAVTEALQESVHRSTLREEASDRTNGGRGSPEETFGPDHEEKGRSREGEPQHGSNGQSPP